MIKKWEKFNENSNESIKKEFKELVFNKFDEFYSIFSDIEEINDYVADVVDYNNNYDSLFSYNFKKYRSYEIYNWLESILPNMIFSIKTGSDILLIKCGILIPGEHNTNINKNNVYINNKSIQTLDDIISSFNRLNQLNFDKCLIDFCNIPNDDNKSFSIFALFKLPEDLVNNIKNMKRKNDI